ncbi:MAG: NADPH-dependent assimilatory sulfite reductase hemoprotein subunit [Chloroflexaceae bacterium]|nr:NADPH-dependent assimilatory sulfite reductase hemoprotein subunit [Chloroflexaceae bacterium]
MTRELQPDAGAPAGLSKVEQLKRASEGLGGMLIDEIQDLSTDHISEEAYQLLKFHGSYQQDDRDQRKERKQQQRDRAWQFMVRTKCPGGRMTAEQYLVADELADTYGNHTLRVTTRQGLQFHGIGKAQLKPLIRALNERLVTTYGACGDVSRNTMTCPVADLLPGYGLQQANGQHTGFDYQALAKQVSDRLLPDSTAYYELWLDGEQILADGTHVRVQASRNESFYGPQYLPRKHKIAIGMPHDNCVDLFTHDLALETVIDDQGVLQGFNLVAGGGLGFTNNKPETFARLGDRIGFLPPDQALVVLETATAIYRDVGDRSNRRHARLKYVLADRGVAWFQAEMARRLGSPLQPPAEVSAYAVEDHLGWQQQGDGRWMVGIWVEHGRIKDHEQHLLKSGLRAIVDQVRPEVRLTAHQNLVLTHIDDTDRPQVEVMIARYGLSTGEPSLSMLRRYAMACPALPTCGLAVAESERFLPDVVSQLEALGHGDDRVWIRMSGCPNSCSRPTTAEIGIIGRSLDLYNIYVGGSFAGTRLAQIYQTDVRGQDLAPLLSAWFKRWKQEQIGDESFGDWSYRVLLSARE